MKLSFLELLNLKKLALFLPFLYKINANAGVMLCCNAEGYLLYNLTFTITYIIKTKHIWPLLMLQVTEGRKAAVPRAVDDRLPEIL